MSELSNHGLVEDLVKSLGFDSKMVTLVSHERAGASADRTQSHT